jgi:hypothetical protein
MAVFSSQFFHAVKGVAQCAVQLESSLSNRKCKANEMEEDKTFGRIVGIVTDAEKFYFMECSMDGQGRSSFKLSEPVVIIYSITTRICKLRWKKSSDILYGCWRRRKSWTWLLM